MKAQALVARNLKKLRVKRGISQEALAVDAAIDRTYISRMERGMENPTVGVLERIANALGVKITDFFIAPASGEPMPKSLPSGRRPILSKR